MRTLGLCLSAGLSLSACTTGMSSTGMSSNSAVVDKTNLSAKVVTEYPLETAMLNIYTKARSQKLYTVIDNQQMIIETTITPKGATLFDDKQV